MTTSKNKKLVESDDKEQSRRFEETARKLGADESGKNFERVFKAITPNKTQKKKR